MFYKSCDSHFLISVILSFTSQPRCAIVLSFFKDDILRLQNISTFFVIQKLQMSVSNFVVLSFWFLQSTNWPCTHFLEINIIFEWDFQSWSLPLPDFFTFNLNNFRSSFYFNYTYWFTTDTYSLLCNEKVALSLQSHIATCIAFWRSNF